MIDSESRIDSIQRGAELNQMWRMYLEWRVARHCSWWAWRGATAVLYADSARHLLRAALILFDRPPHRESELFHKRPGTCRPHHIQPRRKQKQKNVSYDSINSTLIRHCHRFNSPTLRHSCGIALVSYKVISYSLGFVWKDHCVLSKDCQSIPRIPGLKETDWAFSFVGQEH